MKEDYQFFMETNVDEYIGQWVAICEKRIVSHGKDVKKVFREAKKACPGARPLVTRIPDKESMIF
ncbi:MAG: hypothetical protein KAW41_02845 [Candidatus Diapherotrites archaeon]|nr:hypothetical protein [Candidatus Diapherotrites archaeon]